MAKKQVTEADLRNEVTNIRKILKAQDKVKIIIPMDPERPGERFYKGFINGCPFAYERGVLVEVPESVAKLIEDNTKAVRVAEKMEREYTTGAGKLIGGGEESDLSDPLASARAILGINTTED